MEKAFVVHFCNTVPLTWKTTVCWKRLNQKQVILVFLVCIICASVGSLGCLPAEELGQLSAWNVLFWAMSTGNEWSHKGREKDPILTNPFHSICLLPLHIVCVLEGCVVQWDLLLVYTVHGLAFLWLSKYHVSLKYGCIANSQIWVIAFKCVMDNIFTL